MFKVGMIRMSWVVLGLACGGSSGPDNAIQVGGSYPTAVTLGANSCGAVQVAPQTTVVQHTAGATALAMTHGPVSYTGTLQSNGDFVAGPSILQSGGETFTINIAGRFTTTQLIATVTVDVTRATPCQYKVNWVGTKTGAPNVIP